MEPVAHTTLLWKKICAGIHQLYRLSIRYGEMDGAQFDFDPSDLSLGMDILDDNDDNKNMYVRVRSGGHGGGMLKMGTDEPRPLRDAPECLEDLIAAHSVVQKLLQAYASFPPK